SGESTSARRFRGSMVAVAALPVLPAHGGNSRGKAHRALWSASATEGHCQEAILPALSGEVLPLRGQELRSDGEAEKMKRSRLLQGSRMASTLSSGSARADTMSGTAAMSLISTPGIPTFGKG